MGSGEDFPNHGQEFERSSLPVIATSSLTNAGSSRNLLEAAEDTIEELRDEARTWERNARNQMLDLDILRKKFSNQSKKLADHEMELTAACTERDDMKKEVEQLKLLLEDSLVKQTATEDSTFQSEGIIRIQKEMENEMKYQQESNANLALQLTRSQESNIELVSVLQELEETIEKQKVEIENLSLLQLKFNDLEKCLQGNLEENRNLLLQLQQLQESEKTLQVNVQLLEQALEDKNNQRTSTIAEGQRQLEEYILKVRELESLKIDLEANIFDLGKEADDKRSEVGKLEANFLQKEEEVGFLRQRMTELEVEISDLTKEKDRLQENMEIAVGERNISAKCLDDLRNDLMVLSSSVDSHISANKILERKSSELERGKHELELHLFEVEEENVQLSERISGLEAQLRYVTDERESSRLELENSKSVAMGLQYEVERLTSEMETQKVDLKQKLQDMENLCSESQEDCEYMIIENQKLQASSESLIEECNTLKKSNGELRKQKLKLHEHCTHLETELRESRRSLSDCSERVEALEENISSMMEDFALKEKSLASELDALIEENKKQKEKLTLEQSLLNRMYLEKTAEVENIQREVEHLTMQISATHDERERIASEAVHEVSSLRADKAKLEHALQEVHSRVKLTEDELDTIRTKSEFKVQGLTVELAASKQSHEILMADHEKMLKLLANCRSSEEKLKTGVNELELKLTVYGYERQQLIEETASLKAQLQKIEQLQDEVLALKRKLNESKFEKEKLEASLRSVYKDYEELKAEKISFVEKISSLQKSMYEFDDCKRKIIALEEKLLRMEGDLKAKEALCAQDAEMRNELSQIKRANKQYLMIIQQVEDEKDECLNRTRALEEDLRFMKVEKQDRTNSVNKKGDNENGFHGGSPRAAGADHIAKVQLLENELAEALEANNKYKIQLQRFLSEERNSNSGARRKPKIEGEVVAKEGYERMKSSLETELRDLRDRYFQMSLKYAEVEAQREDLVMMLKSANRGKRWF